MKLIRKIIHDLMMMIIPKSLRKNMLSCEEVSHIISENQELPTFSKLKLKMHLFICQKCLDYEKQIQFITENAHSIRFEPSADPENLEKSKNDLINKFSK